MKTEYSNTDSTAQVNIAIEEVTQVYSGRREGCRCGCLGKYYEKGEGDKMIRKVVKILNESNNATIIVTKGEYIIDVAMEDGHVYTAYIEEA